MKTKKNLPKDSTKRKPPRGLPQIILGSLLLIGSYFLLTILAQTPQEIRQRAQTTTETPPQCKATNGTCRSNGVGCFGEENDVGPLDCADGSTCCSFTIPPQCSAMNGVCVISESSCFGTESDLGQVDCPSGRKCCAQKNTPTTATQPPAAQATATPRPTNTPIPTATPLPTAIPTPTSTQTQAQPTTAQSGITSITLRMFLHGLGSSGDNMNTTDTMSNKSPLHTSRQLVMHIDNAKDLTVPATYDNATGAFTGNVQVPDMVSGQHTIQLKTDGYLTTTISQAMTAGVGGTIEFKLTAGDINNDNAVNTLDYNILINCYNTTAPTASCSNTQRQLADVNDDGSVDGIDYNLLLREIAGR